MPYMPHSSFSSPPDPTAIWRYMDFPKLASLLASKALFFPSATVLAKTDQYEGWRPPPDPAAPATATGPDVIDKIANNTGEARAVVSDRVNESLWRFHWSPYCISCWHMNDSESDAMWKVYAGYNGVAVRSSFERLRKCFARTSEDIHIGTVEYADYDPSEPDKGDLLAPFLRKRRAFLHERELRAICVQRAPNLERDGSIADTEIRPGRAAKQTIDQGGGLSVDIDVETLIEAIVVSPQSPSWISQLVRQTAYAFGHKSILIDKSRMASAPPTRR